VTTVKPAARPDEHTESCENSGPLGEPAKDRHLGARRSIWDLLAAVLCLGFIVVVIISVLLPTIAHAEEISILRHGDPAVTAFFGTRYW
jgi:hypothetical protein